MDYLGDKIVHYLKKDHLYLAVITKEAIVNVSNRSAQAPMIIRAASFKHAFIKTLIHMDKIPRFFWHALLFDRGIYHVVDESYYTNINNILYVFFDRHQISHLLVSQYQKRGISMLNMQLSHVFNEYLRDKRQEIFDEIFSQPVFTDSFIRTFLLPPIKEIDIYSFAELGDFN